VVVVSAMSGVTDTLLQIAASAGSGHAQDALQRTEQLRHRHLEAATAVAGAPEELNAQIGGHFDELGAVVRALAVLREVSPGALAGAGVDASEIQIWTDVDGMLTADPRVIDAPRLVPTLSFDEAAELAYFGAKVLHPSTILPAVERNIPVRILNSRKADAAGT